MLASERSRGGQAEMDDFDGFGLKTISGGWFPGFGCKTRGGLGAVKVRAEGTRRHLQTCLRRREVKEEPCPSDASKKIWTVLPLRGCLSQLAL